VIPDTDRAYIAGLFDGEVVFILKEHRKRKKDTKVNQVIVYLIV
jgi:hypothetical protein